MPGMQKDSVSTGQASTNWWLGDISSGLSKICLEGCHAWFVQLQGAYELATHPHAIFFFVIRRVANAQIRGVERIWRRVTGQNTATRYTVRPIIRKCFKPLAVNMLAPMNYDSAIFWKRALWATSLKRWTMHSIFSTHVHHEKKQTAKTKQKQNKKKQICVYALILQEASAVVEVPAQKPKKSTSPSVSVVSWEFSRIKNGVSYIPGLVIQLREHLVYTLLSHHF